MIKKLCSVFSGIFIAILTALLLIALLFNISTLKAISNIKYGTFIKQGYSCVLISSGSMEPSIFVNDLLIIKGFDSYKEDDIVTYVSERGSLITHRIKKTSANGYITKGDANNVPDEEISEQRLLGKVIYILPAIGWILKWILSPLGIIFLACVLLLTWLIKNMRNN